MAELYPDRTIAIIKHAVGGTNLAAEWYPGANTHDRDHFGPQFAMFHETVVAGIDSLSAQGYTPVIRAMLWQQGERDARFSAYGPTYDRNLSHFIKRVRAQYDAPNMTFIYGQVLPVALAGYDYRDDVRQGQFNVDEDSGHPFATDGARLVLADDLPMNADDLHVSAAGQLELGIRFAEALASVAVADAADFNADRMIDGADISVLVDHWHQSEPAYDIAPPPFGDGIVDVQDLIVVADHLLCEIPPAELIAQWNLDETAGVAAHDSVGLADGMLDGDPQWQPADGHTDGALHLDGIDDFVGTPFVMNPASGPFSISVWIKGGAPGQVIISQTDGVDWLKINAVSGTLATDLRPPQRRVPVAPLVSDAVVTDDVWHHAAFVWDSATRTLYLDGMLVADDEPGRLAEGDGDLHIGCGASQSPSTFWAGLIDDVRIYDQAVTP
jgi:hypothetical protein